MSIPNIAHCLNAFDNRVLEAEGTLLTAREIETIQVNIGLTCNLQCRHCHVASGPKRTEQMDWATMEQILRVAREIRPSLIDITGGAPEMNAHFEPFIAALRAEGFAVQVRTNLTILLDPEYAGRAQFMAEQGVRLTASMPCYLEQNVDAQRGDGVYAGSIRALQMLNELGYGIDERLPLDLIYNPLGPALPPAEHTLEADYRRELMARFGIRFSRLHVITNMPIGRFWADLRAEKRETAYQALLEQQFNPATLPGLMCRHLISVDWNGTLHDCDFNLALKLPAGHGAPSHIREFDAVALRGRRIVTGRHCFGCSAGHGSSCGGALVED